MWAIGVDGATVDVQMGFGSAPATPIASVTWTSVVNYVRSLSIDTGRSDELDSYQAGRLSMILGNADRRFDALYTAGPYYGNLKPMCRVRVLHTYGGTTVTKWTGYVSGWPQAYNPPNDATVTVTATDGFTVLQRAKLLSLYAYEVTQDAPALWLRLGEGAGTVAVDSSGNLRDGIYEGGATFNSRTALTYDTDNAIALDGASQDVFVASESSWLTTPFTAEAWVNLTALPTNPAVAVIFAKTGFAFCVKSDGTLFAAIGDFSALTARQVTTSTALAAGTTYHVAVEFTNTSTDPIIYINGSLASVSSSSGAFVPSGSSGIRFGVDIALGSGGWLHGTLDECAIYTSLLSGARLAVHYAAGASPFQGLDTGSAVSKVLDMAGWPSADRTIETGISSVVALDSSAKTALDLIKALEATEQGRFFIAPDGKATFYNRHHTLTTAASTTSQATFGDAPGELPYRGVGFDYGEDKIRNKITTQPFGGSPYVNLDATSITNYLERELTISGLYNANSNEVRDLGLWQLGHYKDPQTRIPAIEIQPRGLPAASLFPHVRDRKLLDRITVKRRPQNIGPVISLDALIEGIRHEITVDPLDWRTTYFVSPADTQAYLILDDTTNGILDTNRLAF